MRFIYYIDGEKFTTNNYDEVPIYEISFLDENTPALEDLKTGHKRWCFKGRILHRLTGPAHIADNGVEDFWLNGIYYRRIKEWIKVHPNPDLYFDAIGIKTETDKVIWYLQN
jgi:hypothetical protein